MKKILLIQNIRTREVHEIKYKTDNTMKWSIFILIIDIISLLLFDGGIGLPIGIFTMVFSIKVSKEIEEIKQDVHNLLSTEFQPYKYDDAVKVIEDFKLSITLIDNKNGRDKLSQSISLKRIST